MTVASLSQLSVGEALAAFRTSHGIDATFDQTPKWPLSLGVMTIWLPNFSWRRAAIQRHDLHHAVTGYPFDMFGECQIATWEFGAGRYPHLGATLLLLPLVVFGLLRSPRAIWRAFVHGRHSRSLYRAEFHHLPLQLPMAALIAMTRTDSGKQVGSADAKSFTGLVLASALTIGLPIMLAFLILIWMLH